jgi:hypothetical protein
VGEATPLGMLFIASANAPSSSRKALGGPPAEQQQLVREHLVEP